MKTDLNPILEILKTTGLDGRGAFYPEPDDQVPDCGFADGVGTVLMVGSIGPAMWSFFEAGRLDEPNPLDQWTKRVLAGVVAELPADLGAVASIHPSDGPPYYPFQQWAMRAECVYPSPIGPLIHPDYGLWHAYRGALLFERRLGLPERPERPNPCDTCAGKPCLATCPVDAFKPGDYDLVNCANYLTTKEGDACLAQGCLARRACPVGRRNTYYEAQTRFHMGLIRDKYATR